MSFVKLLASNCSGMTHPTGAKVSNPLAAAQGRPFPLAASCMFRPVTSIARAVDDISASQP
jgi:hypothetical protein